MGKRKSNLVNKIVSYLSILFILIAASIINFNLLTNVKEQTNQRTNRYKVIHSLLYELSLMVNEIDKNLALYKLTGNESYYQTYQSMIDVYHGKEARDGEIYYAVYNGIKIPYKELIAGEVKTYNEDLIKDLEVIFYYVDSFINFNRSAISSETHIKQLGFNFENDPYNSDYYNLNLKILTYIQNFEYKIRLENQNFETKMLSQSKLLDISLYSITISIFFYLLFLLFRIYVLFIQPIFEGHKLLQELSKGKTKRKWIYKYNNQFKDLIDSFNNYVELNRESYQLIEEQYSKLKIYSDVGELNYFEYDFERDELTIYYSKKFVDKYSLEDIKIVYKFEEYLNLIHKDDLENIEQKIKLILKDALDEFKIEYRVKFPSSNEYCFMACTGQRNRNEHDVFIGVQYDITDLKETQRLLLAQEEQYRIIFENSTDLIAKFDPSGNILYASKSYSDIFKHDHIIGANEKDFRHTLKYTDNHWIEKLLQPPYSSQGLILVSTDQGDKWISFKNDTLLNENNEVESIISVGHDITELKKMNEKLKYDSEHDLLTGLLNRRGLFNIMNELMITELGCFFLDINNFKNINDFYGHEIGDIIIKKVADELKHFSDKNCIISRLSGDEFVILVPNYQTNFNLNLIKNLLNKNLQKNYLISNNNIFISLSVGYALYPLDTDDINKVISYADIAMYEAKVAQEKECVRYTQDMFLTVNHKVEIANDLKKAIDHDEFEMVFQEIVNTKTHKIDFVEALVRWNHPRKGTLGPSDFISVAEESGLMEPLDSLIINKSLNEYREFKQQEKFLGVKLSINVSPIMLLKKDFPSRLLNLVVKLGLMVSDICIEISENTFVKNIEECRVQITKLRQLGFLVALDDFGREFSSLSILDRVEFDIIKIDRLFVNSLEHIINEEVIRMITKITNIKNKVVIVEGVETNDQVLKLMDLGCVLMQGYYFSVPEKIKIEVELIK